MALTKQIHIYSVDTSAFYTPDELKIHNRINKLKKIKEKIKKKKFSEEKSIKQRRIISKATQYAKQKKEELYSCFQNNHNIRRLNPKALNKYNVVSIFDSALTRTLGMEENQLYSDLIIVKTYYFDVLKDIILNGFVNSAGEKYVIFTASAGQIRTKKTVFVKETVWNKYKDTLLCGLSVERINGMGGINVNKYLAYLALCNSATDEWKEFDITRSIVVDDMETFVSGMVDFIDDTTCVIERKQMDIPITHTDGCGMMLPSLCKKNVMIRAPWLKGLLTPFSFDKFIRENNCSPIVVDIFGVEHDLLKENINVIFTKSQFKMYKYYKDWGEYINLFLSLGCSIGKCNEEDEFKFTKLNYQMLQTLSDLSNEELISISRVSKEKIESISTDRKTMLKAFGVTPYNKNKTYLQQALEIYPELLCDNYTKDILCQIKRKMVKDARSAKLDVNGMYSFIVPDMYAFCEYLFIGNKNPIGLLSDGEVSCKLFRDVETVDCLRSPHLQMEHAIRVNIHNSMTDKWFISNALYTSCHDLISKILQFDCDGDRSLVCADETVINAANRNIENFDIVPLYYNMRKAGSTLITNEEIYNGLIAAYTGGNIGQISNDITKIWNAKNIELDLIKILCMMNNFVIDYAKTLYKPEFPDHIKRRIKLATKYKVPHFFMYAKDKKKKQVESGNQSAVNRLEVIIPNKRINPNAKNTGKFDYKKLMRDPKQNSFDDAEILEKYDSLNTKNHFLINLEDDRNNNLVYLYQSYRNELLGLNSDPYYVVDVIVYYLYKTKKSKHKETLWLTFGDIIVENLRNNIKSGYILCDKCGKRTPKMSNSQLLCPECSKYIPKETKTIKCIDCGQSFDVDARNTTKKRCDGCYKKYRKQIINENAKRYYQSKNS